MGEIRQRISSSMTRGEDPGRVALKSPAMAVPGTLFTVPCFYHLILTVPVQGGLPMRLGFMGFLSMELSLLFIIGPKGRVPF